MTDFNFSLIPHITRCKHVFYICFNNCSLVGNYICPDLQVVMQVENFFYVGENAFHNKYNINYLRKIFVYSFSADLRRIE